LRKSEQTRSNRFIFICLCDRQAGREHLANDGLQVLDEGNHATLDLAARELQIPFWEAVEAGQKK
jgi:hypothetical protein